MIRVKAQPAGSDGVQRALPWTEDALLEGDARQVRAGVLQRPGAQGCQTEIRAGPADQTVIDKGLDLVGTEMLVDPVDAP
ncbi:hypothetical protein G3I76_26415 [Streptomyces sp. SID11233]|nr:hypothetical protein [Streptomyces sp. SID11233]